MASDYGLNFGFRRSDESMAIREGRQKTPKTGTALRLGTGVEIDAANPGYLRQSAGGVNPLSGYQGLLVQEESHLGSVFDAAPYLGHDSYDLGIAKRDQLSVIWSGKGTKVWFKNTPAYARGDRSLDAVDIVDLTGVDVGEGLAWNGSMWVGAAANASWMTVTLVVPASEYCEAVLTF